MYPDAATGQASGEEAAPPLSAACNMLSTVHESLNPSATPLQGQASGEEEAAPLNRREARRAERAEARAQPDAQQQNRATKQQVRH